MVHRIILLRSCACLESSVGRSEWFRADYSRNDTGVSCQCERRGWHSCRTRLSKLLVRNCCSSLSHRGNFV